jgi:hypothetical protein
LERQASVSEELVIRRRRAQGSPLHARRIGVALYAQARPGAPAIPFPGLPGPAAGERRDALWSGALSTLLHAAAVAALVVLAWQAPVIQEEVFPVQLLKDAPPPAREQPDEEPAPAPKALAERRADFAPRAQALAPQVINPTVITRAAPVVNAERIEMNAIAQVLAPRVISAARVVVERASAVQSVVGAEASKVDTTAAAPALRGPSDAQAPAGPSVGPRQIATQGDTVGTGTAIALGDGYSVREGIDSTRDVLGTPDGAPLANVNTRVGQGHLRGAGGSGTGSGLGGVSDSECRSRPEVVAYLDQIESRMKARWVVPPEVPQNQQVLLRFVLERAGSLTRVEVVKASHERAGESAMEALRASLPFMPMSERVRCLAGRPVTGTFDVLN